MSFALDWLELTVRWIHVIAGIAWIGTSFYFNWLNDRLTPADPGEDGVVGDLWSVHGGGFYRAVKYSKVPKPVLRELHWFKWEAYLTWISGFALLILVYYLGADVFLLDPSVAAVAPAAGVSIGIGTLLAAWLVYDRLCRSPLAARSAAFATLGVGLTAGAAYGLLQLFGPRAAYLHVGAALGTIMAANVFFVIIPAHRELVAAVEEGRAPDGAVGAHAAMRSRHNNYLTLPVLFVMISGHYPITYGHPWAWLVLIGLFAIGAATRHAFNLRNAGRPASWLLPAAALAMIALGYVVAGSRAAGGGLGAGVSGAADFASAREIIVARCTVCHAAQPAHRLFDAPPAGIILESPEQMRSWAERIAATAVESRVMPLGNFTDMTDEERRLLGRWIEAGARVDR